MQNFLDQWRLKVSVKGNRKSLGKNIQTGRMRLISNILGDIFTCTVWGYINSSHIRSKAKKRTSQVVTIRKK